MHKRYCTTAWVLACLAGTWGAPAAQAAAENDVPLELHVPSPDWRDQIIYFVMLDRFADGDPTNNDQGAGEFDPASGAKNIAQRNSIPTATAVRPVRPPAATPEALST